tara:strand:- start:43 stop:315 length:273 start_codon:yes stop_codon:yes gene_type:complete
MMMGRMSRMVRRMYWRIIWPVQQSIGTALLNWSTRSRKEFYAGRPVHKVRQKIWAAYAKTCDKIQGRMGRWTEDGKYTKRRIKTASENGE